MSCPTGWSRSEESHRTALADPHRRMIWQSKLQARFTKDGLKGTIAEPEDGAEAVGRLITQVGGKLIAYYLTSGDHDILLIFEGPSYETAVPALIVAAAGKRHCRFGDGDGAKIE